MEKNGELGAKSSGHLGVLVCKVNLGHAADWSDGHSDVVYAGSVVGHVGRLHCTGWCYV